MNDLDCSSDTRARTRGQRGQGGGGTKGRSLVAHGHFFWLYDLVLHRLLEK